MFIGPDAAQPSNTVVLPPSMRIRELALGEATVFEHVFVADVLAEGADEKAPHAGETVTVGLTVDVQLVVVLVSVFLVVDVEVT